MLIRILKPDFIHKDDRGTLTQLVHDGYKQVNVIYSDPGSIRGRHYHKENTEAFYIISGKLTLILEKDGVREEHRFETEDMFEVPPYAVHEFIFTEATTLISMYSNGVEISDGLKDIYQ